MLTKNQVMIIRNGLIIMLLGFFGGFGLAFNLIGEISFSPMPFSIPYQVPGSPERWLALHTGNLMNGIMAIVLALIFPYLRITATRAKYLAFGLVGAIWANAIFYFFSIFAPNRGLTFGDNNLGEGNIAGAIAFLPAFMFGTVTIIVVVILIRSLPKGSEE